MPDEWSDWWWAALGNAVGTVLALVITALLIEYLLLVDRSWRRSGLAGSGSNSHQSPSESSTPTQLRSRQLLMVLVGLPTIAVLIAVCAVSVVELTVGEVADGVDGQVPQPLSGTQLVVLAGVGLLVAGLLPTVIMGLARTAGHMARALGHRPDPGRAPDRVSAPSGAAQDAQQQREP